MDAVGEVKMSEKTRPIRVSPGMGHYSQPYRAGRPSGAGRLGSGDRFEAIEQQDPTIPFLDQSLDIQIFHDSRHHLARSTDHFRDVLLGNSPIHHLLAIDLFGHFQKQAGDTAIDIHQCQALDLAVGNAQALHTVIDAAERLRAVPQVRFVLVGSGARGEWLERQIAERRLSNVLMPGRFEPEEMPGIFAQAAVLLVTLASSPIMRQTIPSKVQAYLAAAKPVIASLDGEGARVIVAAGAGVACPAEDGAALADAVRRLAGMSAGELEAMGQAGRRYYDAHYHPALLARSLRDRFLALAGVAA